jgi:hypothetical protein
MKFFLPEGFSLIIPYFADAEKRGNIFPIHMDKADRWEYNTTVWAHPHAPRQCNALGGF